MTEISTISLKNQAFSSSFGSSDMNFAWCYSRALVNVRDIVGTNTTSKSIKISFGIQQINFALKSGTFWSYPVQQSNITLTNLSEKKPYSLENEFGGKEWETKY